MPSTVRRRAGAATVLLAAALSLTAAPGGPAHAEPPLDLGQQVTDRAGVLSDEERTEVAEAVATLRAEHSIDLHVVLVDSFDTLEGPAWTEQTFARSGLGPGDALLAVAVEQRRYGYAEDTEVTTERAEQIAVDEVEPELRDGDWAQAAISAAEGYAKPTTGWSQRAVLTLWSAIGSVVAAVAGGFGLRNLLRRRRENARVGEDRAALAGRLGGLRERLETAGQEQEYVRVQLGEHDARWLGREQTIAQDDVDNAVIALDQVPRTTSWWPPRTADLKDRSGLLERAGLRLDRADDRLTELEVLLGQARDLAQEPGQVDELARRVQIQRARQAATRPPAATAFLRRRIPELLAEAGTYLDGAETGVRGAGHLLDLRRHVDAARDLTAARRRLADATTCLDLADDPTPEVERVLAEHQEAQDRLAAEITEARSELDDTDELRRGATVYDLEDDWARVDLGRIHAAVQEGLRVHAQPADEDDPEASRLLVERTTAALSEVATPLVLLRSRVEAAREAAEAAAASSSSSSSSGSSSSGSSSSSSSSFSSGGGRF